MTETVKFEMNFGQHAAHGSEEAAGCRAMKAIVYAVQEIIADALEDKETHFACIHPRSLIVMIINNIMVNLFFSACPPERNSLEMRLQMARGMMDEIEKIFMDCVEKIEMVRTEPTGSKQ